MLNGLYYYDDGCISPTSRENNTTMEEARFTIFMDKTKREVTYGERSFKDALQLIPDEVRFELSGYRTNEEMLRDFKSVVIRANQYNYSVTEIQCHEEVSKAQEMAHMVGR